MSFASVLLLATLLLWGPAQWVAAADDFAGLSAAIQAANSGSAALTLGGDIMLTAALPTITGRLTIDGGGHSISGDANHRIFDVSGGTLTLTDTTLTGGNAADGAGGAIQMRNGARVYIEDSTLSENSATNGGAIAILSRNDILTVSGSSFLNNRAEKSAAAIYANGGTIDIRNSVFEKNCAEIAVHRIVESLSRATQGRTVDADGCLHVTYSWPRADDENGTIHGIGGAIRLFNRAQANISTSSFRTNKAGLGGAIAVKGPGAGLTVSGSNFDSNFARFDGGALYGSEGALNISNSTFMYNTASSSGGALYSTRADVTMTHVTMVDNAATNDDGDAISRVEGSVKLRNSIIVDSWATDDCFGGLDQVAGNLSTDGTCALLAGGDPLLSHPTGSPAWYPLKDFSPAVDAADPDYCLSTDQVGTARPHGGGCDIGAFESATALPKPPPIEPPPPCPLALQIVAANTDAPVGGCPAGSGHDVIALTADIMLDQMLPAISSDITIEGNGYAISGGNRFRIFDVINGKLTINNVRLMEGKATSSPNDSGGALRLQGDARVIVNDSVFTGNSGTTGGAIGVDLGATALTVNGSAFVSNQAHYGGGAIFSNGRGRITITNSNFRNNATSSEGRGGAINGQMANTIDVSNSTFIGNAANSGGAVSARWASVTLTHVTMVDNAAFGHGIYTERDYRGVFRLRNSLIVGRRDVAHCYGRVTESVGNFIADGTCSPELSGDPLIEVPEAESLPAYLELLPNSPALDAADSSYCVLSDQVGRARPRFSLCDIGALESTPVAVDIGDCRVTTTHAINFRDGPGGARIGAVPQTATMSATARTPGWFQVDHRGRTGWISADFVTSRGQCG